VVCAHTCTPGCVSVVKVGLFTDLRPPVLGVRHVSVVCVHACTPGCVSVVEIKSVTDLRPPV
jgi:hypothetical protein